MGKHRRSGKKNKKDPYTLSAGRIEDEEDKDDEENLSSMLQQFKAQVKMNKMKALKRKLESLCDEDDEDESNVKRLPHDDDEEEEDDSEEEMDEDGRDPDGIDMGTRARWGRQKCRYYVGGEEEEYTSEELNAAIREAEKYDPLRVEDGLEWLANFYPEIKKLRTKKENGEGDIAWSIHSSDVEWSGDEKEEEKPKSDPAPEDANESSRCLEAADSDDEAADSVDDIGEDSPASDNEPQQIIRRPISREMEANRGLVPRRKKDEKNPRVKHRKKYRRALIKHHSQIPKVRREDKRYSGEINGIRCGVVRSRKFTH